MAQLVEQDSTQPAELPQWLADPDISWMCAEKSKIVLLTKDSNSLFTTFQVIGSLLRVYGVLRFRNNNLKGLGGGTLYVVSQGQVLLFPDSKLIFEDNRGV